jgi:hypothetical protein
LDSVVPGILLPAVMTTAQFNLAGTPLGESKAIRAVPNPNPFTTLPEIEDIIRVALN